MGARTGHRAAGLGSIQRHSGANPMYRVYGPQFNGERVFICRADSRWHGERALQAWYVVHAVEMLAALGGQACVKRSA